MMGRSEIFSRVKYVEELISVIMPAYNSEKYIAGSIKSVLAQTYQNWELIVADDCSTDNTAEIVKKFSDNRIKYIKNNENSGVAATRNNAIKAATGKWIAFLDSDDLWESTKLEKQLGFIEKNSSAKFVFTASAFINENSERLEYILPAPEKVTAKELLKQNVLSCSSILIDKKYMTENPFPNGELIHEDYVSWLKILDEINAAYGINEPLLIYRISSDSKSGNKFKAAKMQWNAYKEYGLNFIKRIYYMCWYAVNGLRKYSKIN